MAALDQIYDEAIALQEGGKLEEAVAKLEELLAQDPNYALAHSALSVYFGRMERFDEAVAHAQRVCELEPDDPFSYVALSLVCQKAGMIAEAEMATIGAPRRLSLATRHPASVDPRAAETGPDALLDVDFQNSERRLVALHGQLQGVQHPLGGEEVGDDPLRHGNRLAGHAERLRIQTEIDDQLFRRPRHPAEVRIQRQRLGIVDLHLHPLLSLGLLLLLLLLLLLDGSEVGCQRRRDVDFFLGFLGIRHGGLL